MSATVKNKSSQPALATTGKGAAFCVTLGVTLLTAALAFVLSLTNGGDSYVLSQLSQALQGLGGPMCIGIPLLLGWAGVKLLVSVRHRVAARDVLIVSALYLLLLAGHALIARVQQAGETVSFMDYVGRQNYKMMELGYDSFPAYLYQAFTLRTSGAGGLLGMLLAYPIWKVFGTVVGLLLVAVLLVGLLFLLLRVNPGDLFRSASERGEQRRLRREEKQRQKAQQAQESQQAPAPAAQQYPIAQMHPGQTVERQETVYDNPPPAYYQPAPVYDTTPAPRPAREQAGFYPVQPDLYDERFPLHERETAPADAEPVPAVAAAVSSPRPAPLARPWEQPEPETDGRDAPADEPQQAVSQPVIGEYTPSAAPVSPPAPIPETPSPAPAYAAAPAQAPETPPDTSAAEDDLPWETEPEKAPPQPVSSYAKKTVAPASSAEKRPRENAPGRQSSASVWQKAPDRENTRAAAQTTPSASVKTASSSSALPAHDWAAQVRQREAALEMPEHTTARNDPKPVYTDPVMPITGERVSIAPRSEQPRPDAKLDGTLAPKAKQGEMPMDVPYQAPPMRLLNECRHVPQADAAQEDERRAQVIEGTLGSFGVDAEVRQIMHGPSITRFAIQIAPGVKVSRVANTADNLALELKTKHVRVEAPIQGTNYIGIEVPNALVSTVSLREVLDSEKMRNNPSPLVVALGKDIAGEPVLCDLSKMPHLLIAGATGSGKSVCINSIVCSLLYRTSPQQVRLIMIDPKQVELSVYNSIPHLLVPVVSDPRKAAGALAWVVQEMLERYGKFSAQNVRNLAGYNKVNQGTDAVLPNIVVIIDEMADLMEVCRKDVEESIRRLAALARAAGIYMVLATQRPSVDVITGVIKNNIPSRIAFAVSSGTDSRTIIDINGAEKLMGKGDMLYKPAGTSPLRVQGCLVTDDEVNAITDYIGHRYQTDYDPNIIEHLDNADKERAEADDAGADMDSDMGGGDGSFNDLLRQAIEMAVEDGQSSTSMLQRRLRIGYARAGRLVDEMEKRGIVSQSEGSKPRKTLITREQYYEMFQDD